MEPVKTRHNGVLGEVRAEVVQIVGEHKRVPKLKPIQKGCQKRIEAVVKIGNKTMTMHLDIPKDFSGGPLTIEPWTKEKKGSSKKRSTYSSTSTRRRTASGRKASSGAPSRSFASSRGNK